MSLAALAYARRSWRVFGSGAAPDAFAIGGNSPELVAAFTTQSDGTTAGEYFRKASSETTFDGLFTHSVSTPLTMFDSSGTLVWAPHNYNDQSSDPSAGATLYNTTISGAEDGNIAGVSLRDVTENTATNSRYWTTSTPDIGKTGQVEIGFFYDSAETTRRYIRLARFSSGDFASNFALTVDTATNTVDAISGANGSEYGVEQIGATTLYRVWIMPSTPFIDANGVVPIYVAMLDDSKNFSYTGDGVTKMRVGGAYVCDRALPVADNPDSQETGMGPYVPTTTAAKYLPRRNAYRYNSGWELAGMQMEAAAATQLLHGTDSFATQTETVTAQAYTLQFRGTGSITLFGAHLATLNGTGANDLVSLTFTPSAGTLTLTPSGTVNYPQLETGSIPTSYIPNTAASGTVTRAAETLTIARSNLPSLTDTTPWWFLLDYRMWDEATRQDWLRITDANDEFFLRHERNRLKAVARTPNDGLETVGYAANYSTNYTEFDARLAHRFTTSEHGGSLSGEAYISKAMTEVPVLPGDPLDFTNDEFNGFIREFRFGTGEPSSSALVGASA